MAVIPAARISVGLFSEERRNQTLELLYLTGMGPGELFIGKLLGGMLVCSGDLLALTPFLAMPFLSGGLSLDLYWATLACFPVLLAFTVAVGLLASVVSRDDGAAFAVAVILGGLACLAIPLPYMIGLAVTGAAPFSSHWLCLSPAYGPYLVEKKFLGAGRGAFWMTEGMTLIWTLAGLTLAAAFWRRNWRKEIARTARTGLSAKWHSWLQGSATWRTTLRDRLLRRNPFQWLAEQDRRPVLVAWALIGGVAALWLLGWCAWPRAWASPVNFYLTALILVAGTRLNITYAAARQTTIERRQGSLELLLTTPLQPVEIVNGQSEAVRAQFRPVRLTVAALCLVMMLGGFLTRDWTIRAIITYVFIWFFFLGWCLYQSRETVPRAMWVALNTGRSTYAIFQYHRGNYWWISILINGRSLWGGLTGARNFPSGTAVELVVVICFSMFAFLMVAAFDYVEPEAGQLLIKDMRDIARQPIPDRNDPRFKKWRGRGRLEDA
jgi:hypothetical protein